MCTISMIGDHYRDKWIPEPTFRDVPHFSPPQTVIHVPDPKLREEFEALRKEVLEMKALLKRALKYDQDNGEPDCAMDEKIELLTRVAEYVGVDLQEIFGDRKVETENFALESTTDLTNLLGNRIA